MSGQDGRRGADDFLVDELDSELRRAFRSLHATLSVEIDRAGGAPPLRPPPRVQRYRPVLAPLAVAASVAVLVAGAWVAVDRSLGDPNMRAVGPAAPALTASPALSATASCASRGGDPFRDASGTGNDAVPVGRSRIVGSGPLGGHALDLSGDGWLQTTASVPQIAGTTVALWVRTTVPGGILAQYASSQTSPTPAMYDRMLYLTATGRLGFGVYLDSGSPVTVTSPTAYADGRWHHVAGSVGPLGLRLVVDGQTVATSTSAQAGQSFTGWWRFGNGRGGWPGTTASTAFRGAMAQVATWNGQIPDVALAAMAHARTPTDLAAAIRAPRDGVLTGFWPLDVGGSDCVNMTA